MVRLGDEWRGRRTSRIGKKGPKMLANSVIGLLLSMRMRSIPTILCSHRSGKMSCLKKETESLRLTCGCTLLLAGSMADIIGRRITFLVGSTLYSAFTLGCGLSPTGTALIIFRGFQGLSISLCLTTAVGIISTTFPPTSNSNRRNFAFAATGAASPVGYTVGLVLGGVFVQSVGWR